MFLAGARHCPSGRLVFTDGPETGQEGGGRNRYPAFGFPGAHLVSRCLSPGPAQRRESEPRGSLEGKGHAGQLRHIRAFVSSAPGARPWLTPACKARTDGSAQCTGRRSPQPRQQVRTIFRGRPASPSQRGFQLKERT